MSDTSSESSEQSESGPAAPRRCLGLCGTCTGWPSPPAALGPAQGIPTRAVSPRNEPVPRLAQTGRQAAERSATVARASLGGGVRERRLITPRVSREGSSHPYRVIKLFQTFGPLGANTQKPSRVLSWREVESLWDAKGAAWRSLDRIKKHNQELIAASKSTCKHEPSAQFITVEISP